jgi:uncharacterized protein (DUF58 family)
MSGRFRTPGGLSPDLLERARALSALVRSLAMGREGGVHGSRRPGAGSEFREHRWYQPGDDPRDIDWRLQARADRLAVRRYQADRTVDAHLVLDRSASMAWGTTAGREGVAADKAEAGAILALLTAWVHLRQGDRAGLWLASGDPPVRVAPRGGERALDDLAEAVLATSCAGTAGLGAAVEGAVAAAPRGCITLVSDLLDDRSWLAPLAVHAARGRDATVLHVIDPAEIEFPWDEPAEFADIEDGAALTVNPREVAAAYRAAFAAFLADTANACVAHGIRHHVVRTDRPLRDMLLDLLAADRRRAG